MTLFGGDILDTPEKVAEAGSRTNTCIKCGRLYFSPRGVSNTCYGCYYQMAMEDAEARFRPLAEELERRLEVKTIVDQTGGMVMCLRVPIGKPADGTWTRRYAYFSELPELPPGMGLYLEDDQGEILNGPDQCGEYLEFPGDFHCGGDTHSPCEWYHHPQLCADVAEWAAPLIVEFATRGSQ